MPSSVSRNGDCLHVCLTGRADLLWLFQRTLFRQTDSIPGSLRSTPPAFANTVRTAVPASFELPPPSSPQFLALVPVFLAAAVLTSPQMHDLDDLAGVLEKVVAIPEAPTDAPNMSFAIPAPVAKPRLAAPLRAPGAPLRPPSPAPSPTDAAMAPLQEWIPTIPRGCEDEVAQAFHLEVFRLHRERQLPPTGLTYVGASTRGHKRRIPRRASVGPTRSHSGGGDTGRWGAQ